MSAIDYEFCKSIIGKIDDEEHTPHGSTYLQGTKGEMEVTETPESVIYGIITNEEKRFWNNVLEKNRRMEIRYITAKEKKTTGFSNVNGIAVVLRYPVYTQFGVIEGTFNIMYPNRVDSRILKGSIPSNSVLFIGWVFDMIVMLPYDMVICHKSRKTVGLFKKRATVESIVAGNILTCEVG
jgi:hypothetical protein